MNSKRTGTKHHVVIVGGGFGGLYTAQALRKAPVEVTLIDKRNFHLFQPLLYQVATGGLSPGDIASPLRAILKDQANVTVMQSEVVDVDPAAKRVLLSEGHLAYDSLIFATGARNYYFGQDDWEKIAPGLKTIEDALEIRRRILSAFEAAELESDPIKRKQWLTFAVIGAGPTGVELAGAIAELATGTLPGEYANFDPAEAEIVLIEGKNVVLPPYPAKSSARARRALEAMGVQVKTGTMVKQIDGNRLIYTKTSGEQVTLCAKTVLWAAGMRATSMTEILQRRAGATLDSTGRVVVDHELNVGKQPHIFAIGDMARFHGSDGEPLPAIAPVAMQQGRYVAELICARLAGKRHPHFVYRNRGELAVIGRNRAVGKVGNLEISGFPAWVAWVSIHLWYLVEFDNKLLVFLQWAWNYFTRKRGARLITDRETISTPINAKTDGIEEALSETEAAGQRDEAGTLASGGEARLPRAVMPNIPGPHPQGVALHIEELIDVA